VPDIVDDGAVSDALPLPGWYADGEPSGCAEVVKLDILGYSLNTPKLYQDAIDESETVNQVEPLRVLVTSSATSHA
jgi:hypothetical protein